MWVSYTCGHQHTHTHIQHTHTHIHTHAHTCALYHLSQYIGGVSKIQVTNNFPQGWEHCTFADNWVQGLIPPPTFITAHCTLPHFYSCYINGGFAQLDHQHNFISILPLPSYQYFITSFISLPHWLSTFVTRYCIPSFLGTGVGLVLRFPQPITTWIKSKIKKML